jgi:hypothetical protein
MVNFSKVEHHKYNNATGSNNNSSIVAIILIWCAHLQGFQVDGARRPSRKFLEKFKIIIFSNFSRNYFQKIREIRENRFKVIFVF